MKLEIRKKDDTPSRAFIGAQYSYLLDGFDISPGLTQLTLRMGAQDVNACEITILPSEVEIDAEALFALEAVLEDPA